VPKRHRLLLLATLAVALALGARHALSGEYLVDDSFISYRYAERLVHGLGLTFNTGERVEGYTNFLWVLVSAGLIEAGLDPAEGTRAIGVAALLATIGLVFAVLRALARRGFLSAPAASLLLLLAGLDGRFARFSATGMETPLFALLVAAFAVASAGPGHESRAARVGWQVLPLLLCLTRPDGLLFVLAGAAARWWLLRQEGRGPVDAALAVGRRLLPAAAGVLVFLAWKGSYYGSLLPNSFFAKSADQSHWGAGLSYLLAYLVSSLHVAVLLPFVALGLTTARQAREAPLAVFCGLSLLLYVAYVARVGGDFMEYRFMHHVYPLVIVLAALGVGRLEPHARGGTLLALAFCVGGTAGPLVLEKAYGMQSLEEMAGYARVGRLVGKALPGMLPGETVIATRLAGTLPYYSRLWTVDQWGLNDLAVSRQGQLLDPYQRGHMRVATPDYLAARGVNLVFDHPVLCPCVAACLRPDARDVLLPLQGGACVRAEYLVATPRLTQLLCARSDVLISGRDALCAPPPAAGD